MKGKISYKITKTLLLCGILCCSLCMTSINGMALAINDGNTVGTTTTLSMSPMINRIVLNPGEAYTGSFELTVPASSNNITYYEISISNFYRDNNGNAVFEEVSDTGRILDWITIDSPVNGSIEPNNSKTIYYTVNVPEDAPAGGQYAMIRASTVSRGYDTEQENQAIIQERLSLGHIIYAEISGNTVHQGEILSAEMPSFIFNGGISASSAIKNTGNTHGVATYKLQVYPLFSDEEIYTNEEAPEEHTILPGLLFYNETIWDSTSAMGIFNVIYTVEFEGVTAQVSKMVIKCPIWLLFIIIFAITALIIWLVVRAKSRKRQAV